MAEPVSPDVFARRLIDLYGGRAAASEALERRYRAIAERWDQDSVTIGRILRSHLFVEHYLTEYLKVHNPNLGDLEQARLSFAQKLYLIADADNSVAYLVPGMQRLNRVRNRLAHTLRSEITIEDRDFFCRLICFSIAKSTRVT